MQFIITARSRPVCMFCGVQPVLVSGVKPEQQSWVWLKMGETEAFPRHLLICRDSLPSRFLLCSLAFTLSLEVISTHLKLMCVNILKLSLLSVWNKSEEQQCSCQRIEASGTVHRDAWAAAYMYKLSSQKAMTEGYVSLFSQTAWSEASSGLPLFEEPQRQLLCGNAKLRLAPAVEEATRKPDDTESPVTEPLQTICAAAPEETRKTMILFQKLQHAAGYCEAICSSVFVG